MFIVSHVPFRFVSDFYSSYYNLSFHWTSLILRVTIEFGINFIHT